MGGHESTPTASQAAPFPVDGAHLAASGPDQADDTLLALLVTAAYRARQRIALATPYFVPDPALLMALCLAARRGVAIDLLLPARSNHRLSDPVGERRQPSYRLATGERLNPTDDPAVFETLDRSRRFTLRQPP